MVDISTIYKSNSDYLKAEDIGNNMWTYTIRTADVKEFDNGDRKMVVTFVETEKTLPLNVTNARAIGDLYGPDSDNWIGQRVMLFSMPVDFQGKMVNAIRVRAPQPVQNAPQRRPAPAQAQRISPNVPIQNREFAPLPDSLDDEIPF